MVKFTRGRMALAVLICSIGLVLPVSSFANLNLKGISEKLSLSADFRARYEHKKVDVSNENETDRMRQRFRVGLSFDTTESWKIHAGLTTGGSSATGTNYTTSSEGVFSTGDLRLDYVYAEHKFQNVKIAIGQQKNLLMSSWALWDSDVRPVALNAVIDLDPAFVLVGWYDVLYADKDMAQMEVIQAGAKLDMMTAAVSFYNYHDDDILFAEIGPAGVLDEDYKYQIVDFIVKGDIKLDPVKITPQAHFFMNVGAKGDKGQSILGGNIDPEEENIGWMVGIKVSTVDFKASIDYGSIGADACIPLLKDSDIGSSIDSVDVQGFKLNFTYYMTKNWFAGITANLYEAKERDLDQDLEIYQVDLNYKF